MNSLEILKERIPFKIFATNDLEKGIYKKLKEIAITEKYIQIQLSGKLIHSLVFDLDFAGAAYSWQDANLPEPSIIAINKRNGHAHLTYLLTAGVCASLNARSKPLSYLFAIKAAYSLKLGADMSYSGLITKNPLSVHWRVLWCDRSYDLAELAEYVELKSTPANSQINGIGRNLSVFETARKYAYQLVNKHQSFNLFASEIQQICIQINAEFDTPLPSKEVSQIARSISDWCWKNRHKIGKNAVSQIVINRVKTAIETFKITHQFSANLDDSLILIIYKKQLAEISNLSLSTIKRAHKVMNKVK